MPIIIKPVKCELKIIQILFTKRWDLLPDLLKSRSREIWVSRYVRALLNFMEWYAQFNILIRCCETSGDEKSYHWMIRDARVYIIMIFMFPEYTH